MFSDDTSGFPGPSPETAPAWLADVRASVAGDGPHLAWEGEDGVQVAPIAEGFTRVGRSMMADILLPGPTVSRRHALVHREGDAVTVIDDHSLNGVFLDGDPVDWAPLEDGNELELGGFHLHFIAG
jgi:pSer/pThr/pTyr-binding forkhead associated (FHA) protein